MPTSTVRTTLLLKGLPEGDAGTIEVFAGDTCADPEAKYLLEINRVKGAEETARIIQIIGNATRDHYTVTYTHTNGKTSDLSNCIDHGTYPDGDGDGAVDPLDSVLDGEDDPTKAVIATDTEQLLVLSTTPVDPETGEGAGTSRASPSPTIRTPAATRRVGASPTAPSGSASPGLPPAHGRPS